LTIFLIIAEENIEIMKKLLFFLFCFAIGIASLTAGDSPGVIEKASTIESVSFDHMNLDVAEATAVTADVGVSCPDTHSDSDLKAASDLKLTKIKPVNVLRYRPLLASNEHRFYQSKKLPPNFTTNTYTNSAKGDYILLSRPGWRSTEVKL
jgi:hypothetical protein